MFCTALQIMWTQSALELSFLFLSYCLLVYVTFFMLLAVIRNLIILEP